MASGGTTDNVLQKWLDGRSAAVNDVRWKAHDATVNTTASTYITHLKSLGVAPAFDARIIKAMLWVESGANDPAWNKKPMQIGVPGDPGLKDFFNPARPGPSLIPPSWRATLTAQSAVLLPVANIQAGTGYLLMMMGTFAMSSFNKLGGARKMVTIQKGDTIERIAKLHQSTTLSILASNPTLRPETLRVGQTIVVAEAELRWTPTKWSSFDASTIARLYNGGGDKNYEAKLGHCMKLVGL